MIYSFLHLIFLGSFFPFITILIGMPSLYTYISKSDELNMQNIIKPCRIFIYFTTRAKKTTIFTPKPPLLRNFILYLVYHVFFIFKYGFITFYNHFNTHQTYITNTRITSYVKISSCKIKFIKNYQA